ALSQIEAADLLGPQNFTTVLALSLRARAHFRAGRIEQALEIVERSLHLNSSYYPSQVLKILCLTKLERWDSARDALRRWRQLEPEMERYQSEDHVRMTFSMERNEEHIADLRKLWDETEGGA